MASGSSSTTQTIEYPALTRGTRLQGPSSLTSSASQPQRRGVVYPVPNASLYSHTSQNDNGEEISGKLQGEERTTVLESGMKAMVSGASPLPSTTQPPPLRTEPIHASQEHTNYTTIELPIPIYSFIDPSPSSSSNHHYRWALPPITPISPPSRPDAESAASETAVDHNSEPTSTTADPHAPSADADTINLLRYNEQHGHGGAPVTRMPEAVHHLPRHRNGGPDGDADDLSLSSRSYSTLPAYGENIPPRYTRRFENSQDEPQTLAMMFFKFGFFFPAFWIFGALMLITPLRSPNPLSPEALESAWPPNAELVAWVNQNIRTEEDKEAFLLKMHQVEMKWAKRCLSAILILMAFCAVIGLMIFGVLKGTKAPAAGGSSTTNSG